MPPRCFIDADSPPVVDSGRQLPSVPFPPSQRVSAPSFLGIEDKCPFRECRLDWSNLADLFVLHRSPSRKIADLSLPDPRLCYYYRVRLDIFQSGMLDTIPNGSLVTFLQIDCNRSHHSNLSDHEGPGTGTDVVLGWRCDRELNLI